MHLPSQLLTLVSFATLTFGRNSFSSSRRQHTQIDTISIARRAVDPLLTQAFTQSSWISLSSDVDLTRAPEGSRAFRRLVPSPDGQTAASADIAITADNAFILFVNGAPIGATSTSTPEVWKQAQVYHVALNATNNLFAVQTINDKVASLEDINPVGLLMTALITFTDGTKAAAVSDDSWVATDKVTADFHFPSLDTSSWARAAVIGRYGEGVWSDQAKIVDPATVGGTNVGFANSSWIWFPEASTLVPPAAPPEPRSFRKTFTSPQGKQATSATIVLAADNSFHIFVNGEFLGSSLSGTVDAWHYALRYRDVALQASSNVFAVLATNDRDTETGGANPAGLLVAIEITFSDASKQLIVSDDSWVTTQGSPDGFEATNTDESKFSKVRVLGAFTMTPWNGQISITDSLAAKKALITTSTGISGSSQNNAPSQSGSSSSKQASGTTSTDQPAPTDDSTLPGSASMTHPGSATLVSFLAVLASACWLLS